jgi:protocatechuate 3,4-dioxygenase beta subunit
VYPSGNPPVVNSSHPVVNYATGANESIFNYIIVPANPNMIEVRVLGTDALLSNFTSPSANHPTGDPFQTWILDFPGSPTNHGHVYNNTDSNCNTCHGNLSTKAPNFSDITFNNGWCFKCHYGKTGPRNGFVDPTGVVAANGAIAGTVTNASSGLAIVGATVAADTQSNITDANGNYSISIAAGTYTVTASATGYQTNTTTGVVVTSGNVTTQNVALTPLVTPPTFNISGFKINDTNGNGVWDAGEMGIENWNIKLFNNSGTPIASTSTNAQGFYQFTNLIPDRYNVTEEMKTGFTPTNTTTKEIIVENMDVMSVNFTNQVTVPPGTFNISGFKVNDTNGNGVWDSGEMGIENWNIMLLNDTGVQLANTSTDASGFYQFMNIFPGDYNVAEEMKGGFTSTNATSMPVTVENMDVTSVNFTNQVTVPPGTFNISGFKVNDTNGNNVWEPGEMGIDKWNIMLQNDKGTQIASTSTDASGFYEFTNLDPGTYKVTEEMKEGFSPSGATTRMVTIENKDVSDVNFLNHVTVPPVTNTISGFKINDLNGNGKQDQGEEGLPGWNIRLIGIVPGTAGIDEEATTDDNGFYSFENLPAGMYLVVETLKGSYVPVGSPVLVINLANGMNSMNNNFMNRPVSSLIPSLPGISAKHG